jgi:hypothetical protein
MNPLCFSKMHSKILFPFTTKSPESVVFYVFGTKSYVFCEDCVELIIIFTLLFYDGLEMYIGFCIL